MTLEKTDELLVHPKGVDPKVKIIADWFVCDACKQPVSQGFIHVVGVRNEEPPENIKDMDRTGEVAVVSMSLFADLFSADMPDNGVMFCGPDVMAGLKKLRDVQKEHAGQEEKHIIH